MTVLALDLGNTALKGALVRADGTVVGAFRLPTADLTREAVAAALAALPEPFDAAGLASVVPARAEAVAEAVAGGHPGPLVRVHAGLRLPYTVGYTTPHTLGADRLAAVAGAFRPGEAAVVVSAGTALTVEALTAGGVYLGGAIAPGPGLLARALAAGTGQLPAITPRADAPPIGRSTAEALDAGVSGLFVEGAAGLVRRVRGALGAPAARVVLTGGWAGLLGGVAEAVELRPGLVLEGVARLVRATV